ncbi:N-acyl-D-amino-acid deacylase family protein [Sphingobium subterraneum]|uniref:N-acyl-D-aspartate/D-glutamate deacylase n=1 Tax=Sphingobium subterraneum TaxID=627688 RepID=A0A841IXM4_9SPHN|nr:amidohydrolase family protein [Sphingobium subterraneum]MBB6123377.1 N-acyl-D-aspartate/D-glutamate deacylase [Sphingobium subterraneum]
MSESFDAVIRNGTVVDGSGSEAYTADIAISGGVIHSIGKVEGTGRTEVDATGKIVTPGFIDVHTHYDGHVTWGDTLRPSTHHGVTTVVIGNCGLGFAPCKPSQRDMLVTLMEGIEDIPRDVMTAGLPWKWETFPEFMDFLSSRSFDADVAVLVPHAAIRVYVMGERATSDGIATPEDLEQMTALVAEAVRAGAIGVATSRHYLDCGSDGKQAPHVKANREELLALARGLKLANGGIFQVIPRMVDFLAQEEIGKLGQEQFVKEELDLFREISEVSGRPLTYSLMDSSWVPGLYAHALRETQRVNDEHGTRIKPQVFPRPIGMLIGLDLSVHPFKFHPSYMQIKDLPLAERVAIMRDPEFRKKLLSEEPDNEVAGPLGMVHVHLSQQGFQLGNPPRYTLEPERSMRFEAERRGVSNFEVALDWLLEMDGRNLYAAPGGNVGSPTLDDCGVMLKDPNAIVGLGDGGAHSGFVSDASFPTTLLGYWARDRKGEGKISLPLAVNLLSYRNAEAFGMADRGLLAPGMRADLNIIDFARLDTCLPETIWDLPANERRVTQHAQGYVATMLRGEFTSLSDQSTGATPGGLVRYKNAA